MLVSNELIEASLDKLCLKNDSHILKIGVVDGQLERQLASRSPNGSILGIDTYHKFIEEAQHNTDDLPHVNIKKMHAREISFENEFDFVCSFMCLVLLQNPFEIYERIYTALKPGGQMLFILPSQNSPLEGSFYKVVNDENRPEFKDIQLPYDVDTFFEIDDYLSRIPFSSFKIDTPHVKYELPSLQTFRDFLNILHHLFKKELSDEKISKLFDAQTQVFNTFCQKEYGGQYFFEFTPFVVTAIK